MDTLNLIILSQDKTSAARAFYLKMAIRKRWSKRKLERPFRGALFERVVLSPPKMSALPTHIHWRGVDTSDVKRMWFTAWEKQKLKLCKDDLLVCEGGDVGRSALWNDEIEGCYIQNPLNRVRARENADTRFLFYWLYFIKQIGYIDMICNKATIAHFTVEKVEATP